MNSTVLPSRYFGTHRFAAASLTWPEYATVRNVKIALSKKIALLLHPHDCRRSVQFGCYITWLWMAKCVSVMTKVVRLYNFTIPCRGRRAWTTSQYARTFAGSRFWLVESMLFGDHVSLRLNWEFSLKFNLFVITIKSLDEFKCF